jgi:hypothetical protein
MIYEHDYNIRALGLLQECRRLRDDHQYGKTEHALMNVHNVYRGGEIN